MLQDIRSNAQGTIAKIIIGLLVIGLSMFGMDAIIGGFSGEPEVATVNGEEITEREFLRMVQMQRQRQLSQMETPDPSLLNEDEIRSNVLDSLVRQAILVQDARNQGFELSSADVDNLITTMEQFQVDGSFSEEAFKATVRNMGMGVTEFREALREQYLINQVRGGVLASASVTDRSLETLLTLQSQKRTFETLSVRADEVSDQVSVSEEQIKAYYDNNQDQFKQPERVDVAWITLSAEKLAEGINVTEEAIRDRYEQRLDDLQGQEQRRASHILIESGDDAEATMNDVQEKLEQGTSFETLAQEYSDDPLSAEKGGDLGFAGRGVYEPAFEETLFGLNVGQVSAPVETRFGLHLIRLDDVREAEKPTFEDMREEIAQNLALERAQKTFSEKRSKLADLAYSEPNLTVPAEELGLTIDTRKGIPRDGGDAPFDHKGLVRQLYSDDVLNGDFNTELVEVTDGRAVVARVEEHHPGEQLPLSAVAGDIRETLREEAIAEALAEQAQELVRQLNGGDDRNDIAQQVASDWTRHEAAGRASNAVDRQVLSKAFRMPRPEQGGMTYDWTGGSEQATVIALASVEEGSTESQQASRGALQRFLGSQTGQQEYAAYVESLRKEAEIERN